MAEALATLQRKSIVGNALSSDFPYPGNLIGEGTAMKAKLRALIERKIQKWQEEGIYENIYAISLYVSYEEDDPRRPVAVLGYNTREQAQRSALLASNEQEARWNYAFWLQNEELCWGRGDTAREVSQWIDSQGLRAGDDIAGAFRELLVLTVKEIHASGLLKGRSGAELSILIHGLEYDQDTAWQNLEANGETLDKDFLAFCGLKPENLNPDGRISDILSKPVVWKKEAGPEEEAAPHYGFSHRSDVPGRFSCGEIKADMRHVVAFILTILFVMFSLFIYGIIRDSFTPASDIEESRELGQQMGEENLFGAVEAEENSMVFSEVGESRNLGAQAAEFSQEQTAAATDEEVSARQWQVFIHPDVPEPLAEVLRQYEKVMKADFDLDEFNHRDSKQWSELGIEGLYVYDEVYAQWCYAAKEDRDVSICYSLEDLTGDGIPELIMGGGYYHEETICYYPMIVYYIGKNGDIQSIETTPYYDMSFYEGGILEFVSAGINYTITYYQYSQEEQDWKCVETLGAQWDNEKGMDVKPYRQITPDGAYEEQEMLSVEEFQRLREQYTQKKTELQWYSLCRPDWHILVSSGRNYDLYLEGISTDLWLEETVERQLCFSVWNKEGRRVQELTETSPFLPYMPQVYYAESTDIEWNKNLGNYAGNFYFQDMNFDGEEDLVLLWSNINHAYWKVYLWKEEEGIFRECGEAQPYWDGEKENEGIFSYYYVVEDKKYIDEYVSDGHGQMTIYRMRYDEKRGYLCTGALEVYYEDDGAERYQEYFYEDGSFVSETEIISQGEISGLWSDLWE